MPASPERLYVNDSGNTEKEQKTIEKISAELQKIEAEEGALFRYAENETDPSKRAELKKQYTDTIERNKKKRTQLDQLAKQTFTRDSAWKAPKESHATVSDLPLEEEDASEPEPAPTVTEPVVEDHSSAVEAQEVENSAESIDQLLLHCDKQVSALNDFFAKRKENNLPEIHDPSVMKELRKTMETIHYAARPDGLAETLLRVSELVSRLFVKGEELPFDGAENIEEIGNEILALKQTVLGMTEQVSGDSSEMEEYFEKAQGIIAERLG